MISIEDFKVASFEKKCDLITRDTDYVISRETEGEKIYLYYTGKFFIEVYYSPLRKRVVKITAFADTHGLQPYLAEISLNGLVG